MCILLAQKMCTFEILSPRVDIVNYLVPRWHVSSTSCNLLFVWCEDDVGYPCYLPPGIISIYFLSFDNWYSLLWQNLLIIFTLPFVLLSFSLAKDCVNSRCLPYHLWILFISCSCLVFSRYSESGDPTLCILYSNAILYNAQLVGELSYFLQNTLLVILIKCVLVEGKPFLFGTLCHHETLLRAWFVWNHPLFGSLTSLVQCVSMDISFLDVSLMISSK